jgi:hypothetical protein
MCPDAGVGRLLEEPVADPRLFLASEQPPGGVLVAGEVGPTVVPLLEGADLVVELVSTRVAIGVVTPS